MVPRLPFTVGNVEGDGLENITTAIPAPYFRRNAGMIPALGGERSGPMRHDACLHHVADVLCDLTSESFTELTLILNEVGIRLYRSLAIAQRF